MKKRFYSHGKLLLSGEYLVLDGVGALAVPTRFGQAMELERTTQPKIEWKSRDVDGAVWMEESLDIVALMKGEFPEETSDQARTLWKVLRVAHQLNEKVLSRNEGFKVETHLTFPRLWGLGTSSTWIANVAAWFQIDAYELLDKSFGGSGYDIACAQHDYPICYRRYAIPRVEKVDFNPPFVSHLYFVYLNQKQSSKKAIETYRRRNKDVRELKNRVEAIAVAMLGANNLSVFQDLMHEHEQLISGIIEEQTVQEKLFPDFEGSVKSLGAWGGDFVLVASEKNPVAYFNKKGFGTILRYEEMVL